MSMTLRGVRVIDPVLSEVAQGYKHPDYVGHTLFPAVPVRQSGGQVLEFGKESFQQYSTVRAPGAAAKRISFGYLGRAFALEGHSLDAVVPREHLRDAEEVPGVDLAQRATNGVMRTLLLSLEVAQATLATTAGNYNASHKVTNLSGTTLWSHAECDPTVSIEAGKEAIRASTGMYPNVLVLSPAAASALKANPSILEKIKYSQRAVVTTELLAALFDIPRVVVGRGVTANGAGVFSDIWGNNAVLAYAPEKPTGQEEPSYGYTYTMVGHPFVEKPYFDESSRSWIYGVSYERAAVLSGISAGYLIVAPA